MFKIFGFGRNKSAPSRNAPQAFDQGATTRQHTDIQRELVRVVLKDTLRQHGIPGAWLTCEVTALTGLARGDDILVRLVVLKWHEPLLKFLPALQQQLIVGLDRFEPSVDHSKYVVSWQFARDCGCPHTQLPDAKFWTMEDIPKATEAPAPSIVDWAPQLAEKVAAKAAAPSAGAAATGPGPAPAKPKFDLPDGNRDIRPSTFAATEPAPLTPAQGATPTPKPKFDLPASPMDALPSNFAPTEPGPMR
jgi:hypothetical protein